MKKYEQIDISGDVGLKVNGATLAGLFENAAAGMFNLITETAGIAASEDKKISLCADNIESLLVQWLNELVFLIDTYNYVGTSFSVLIKGAALEASVSGGYFDPRTNESRLLIKAATYHNLSIKKVGSRWEATVIFDI